jgi:hypothetical protein
MRERRHGKTTADRTKKKSRKCGKFKLERKPGTIVSKEGYAFLLSSLKLEKNRFFVVLELLAFKTLLGKVTISNIERRNNKRD